MNEYRRFTNAFLIAFVLVAILWAVKGFELTTSLNFVRFGCYPRTVSGLKGILTMPLVHGDGYHLFNNSVAILFFVSALFYFFPKEGLKIFLISYFVPGILICIFGRESYHIGFSGVIFSIAFFEFFVGIFLKNRSLMAFSLVIIFLYGSMFWGIFPVDEKISWEGHLFGALTGTLTAYFYARKNRVFPKSRFEHTFTQTGNFYYASSTAREVSYDVPDEKEGKVIVATIPSPFSRQRTTLS